MQTLASVCIRCRCALIVDNGQNRESVCHAESEIEENCTR